MESSNDIIATYRFEYGKDFYKAARSKALSTSANTDKTTYLYITGDAYIVTIKQYASRELGHTELRNGKWVFVAKKH